MAKCEYCGRGIVIGGVRNGQQQFCNNKCAQAAQILAVAQTIPANVLEQKIEEAWRGNCPKCNGPGPVDVHKFYQIFSVIVLSRRTTNSQVSCRSCATKRQIESLLISLVCGWWGIPHGIIFTPVQITRNIVEMTNGPKSNEPSPELRKMVKLNIGAQMLAKQNAGGVRPGMAVS